MKFLFLYMIIFLFFSIFSYAFIDPNFPPLQFLYYGLWPDFRLYLTSFYVIAILGLYTIYFLILKISSLSYSSLKKTILIVAFLLIAAYPAVLSYDIFNYMATAKVAYYYQENPYAIMPIEFAGDSILGYTRAANKLALYGPSWIVLTVIPFTLSFGKVLLMEVLFKVFVGIFYFGIVYVLYKMTRNIMTTAFFALNPLILIETFASGHNDVVMMFFSLLAFYLLTKKKWLFSLVAIIISVFIKFSTFLLLPIWAYCVWKVYKKEQIKWENVWAWSAVIMFIAFLLSPIREEMYPWYAIWFLAFVPFLKNKTLQYGAAVLTLGLMLRYAPYMLFGSYSGITPLIRIAVTILPVAIFGLFVYVRKILNR